MLKNKAAVHLGKLSADKRRKSLGEQEFTQRMKEIRKLGVQKKLSTGAS